VRKRDGELRIPLGQRIAHMTPEGRRSVRDPSDELLVGAFDVLLEVQAGKT
jgi:hypothetical protein